MNLLFEQLIQKQDLTDTQMFDFINACMKGQIDDIQIAVFLALMRSKGETSNELTAAAQAMQQFATTIDVGDDILDIVGTGGDGHNTFNISTACSFVVAASGQKVAKHGNRSVSSQSGSADLLETAGFSLKLTPTQAKQCIDEYNIAFLFAPHYHPAMRHAREARKQLGIRTLFNLLGPLLNPAGATKHVIGVFAKQWLKPMAEVLKNIGAKYSMIVHSQDGLDEFSIAAVNDVMMLKDGEISSFQIDPKDFGLYHPTLDDIAVNSPQESLNIIMNVFKGGHGPATDIVVLNSAAALYCCDNQLDFSQAVKQAQQIISDGLALECFNHAKELTLRLTDND